jgi:hypothetical protein
MVSLQRSTNEEHDMKKHLTTICAALMATTALSLAGAPAEASGANCYGVQASASTSFDPIVGGFAGDAAFRMNGDEFTFSAVAKVTSESSTTHAFETPWGTLKTEDELILVPVDPANGVFSLRSRMTVVEGGSGKLQLLPSSRLDLVNGTASWQARGHVCIDG